MAVLSISCFFEDTALTTLKIRENSLCPVPNQAKKACLCSRRPHPRGLIHIKQDRFSIVYDVVELAIFEAEPVAQRNDFRVRFHELTAATSRR
jgi:hypothetical protein